MPSVYDALLNPEGDDQMRNKATVAALRRQSDFGALGQLMGLEPTTNFGNTLQQNAQQSFGAALQQQQQARAERMRAGEREEERTYRNQQQQNWQAQQLEQRRQFDEQEKRLREKDDNDPYKRFRGEDTLRAQLDKQLGDIQQELTATSKVKELSMLGREPNALEQQAMVILLNKFLDPGSVVREGEFSRVVEAQGLNNRASNALKQLMEGKPLGAQMLADMQAIADVYEKAATARGQRIAQGFWQTAAQRQFDPTAVVQDPRFQPQGQAGPPPGAVRPAGAPAPQGPAAPPQGAPMQPQATPAPQMAPPGAVRPRQRNIDGGV